MLPMNVCFAPECDMHQARDLADDLRMTTTRTIMPEAQPAGRGASYGCSQARFSGCPHTILCPSIVVTTISRIP